MTNENLILRNAVPEDLNLMYNSWLREYRYSDFTKGCPSKLYYKNHGEIITKLLQRSNVRILCDEQNPSSIFGYIVYDYDELSNLIIHYVYVKSTYRKCKLAKFMINSAISGANDLLMFASHYTKKFEEFVNHTKLPIVYNPYLLIGVI